MGAVPTAPAPRSALLAVVGWLRREYEYSVLGRRPVVMPTQTSATSTIPRVVQGTMNASGPNANLSYEVTEQPLGGIVTVDANGQWTYTAVDGFPSEGGADEFTVKVTDKAVHLANLFGTRAYTSTVTVPVTVPQRSVATGPAVIYTITNSTNHTLTVSYPEILPPRVYNYPSEYTKFLPGDSAEFWVTNIFDRPDFKVWADFVGDDLQTYTVIMKYLPGGLPYVECNAKDSGGGSCNSGPIKQVVLLGPPGTPITIATAEAKL
jgi:VCBS repeat-containing protein